ARAIVLLSFRVPVWRLKLVITASGDEPQSAEQHPLKRRHRGHGAQDERRPSGHRPLALAVTNLCWSVLIRRNYDHVRNRANCAVLEAPSVVWERTIVKLPHTGVNAPPPQRRWLRITAKSRIGPPSAD